MIGSFLPLIVQKDPSIRLQQLPVQKHDDPPAFRIILNGKKTPVILEHAYMSERAWAKRTSTGLIYGEALADFSGAYSGTWTVCFAKYHGKFFAKKYYETKFGHGDSVLFVPFQQPVWKDSKEAFLFTKGKFYSLGQVFEITGWTDKGIQGYVYVDDKGTPTNTPHNFDVMYRVYKQDFIIHSGMRTLLTKTLVYKGA